MVTNMLHWQLWACVLLGHELIWYLWRWLVPTSLSHAPQLDLIISLLV